MTALAGICYLDGRPAAADDCARMLAAQAIYGPHGMAQWDDGMVALGRRLFRSLPEDRYDHGPITGGSGLVLVADIRLDNREELAAALQVPAPRAAEMADADFLFAAWERWSEGALDRLYGDYAFALWDAAARKLILARDAMGGRPLHYHAGKDFFAFASMPKGLHALAAIPYAPDDERMIEFLALLPERGPRSFFKDVSRVEPGHVMTVYQGGCSVRRYWEPRRGQLTLRNPAERFEATQHYVDAAVRARLRGTGDRVGAHLSSGLDSSIVTTSAAVQTSGKAGVVAFTAVPREGFADTLPRGMIGDEGELAARTASRYPNITHVRVRSVGRSPVEGLDRNFILYDMPVLNPWNGTWSNAINDAARERGISVLLTGWKGNMSVSYDGLTLLPRLLREGCFVRWMQASFALVRNGGMRWRAVMMRSLGPYASEPIWALLNRVFLDRRTGPQDYTALNSDRLKQIDTIARLRGLDLQLRPHRDGFALRLWMLGRADAGNIQKGQLAGWGIDRRSPLTDRRLIEFTLSLPDEAFLSDGRTRALARGAFAERLPRQVTDLAGRGFQAADWYEAVAGAWASIRDEAERFSGCDVAATVLDLGKIGRILDERPSGDWRGPTIVQSHRNVLLRAISAGHFLRKAAGSNR